MSNKKEIVSFLSNIYHYTTKIEIITLLLGTIAALGGGTSLPLFALVFGNFTDSLAPKEYTYYNPNLLNEASDYSLQFVYIGIGVWVCNFLSISIYLSLSEKITGRIRHAYFQAILQQEIGWFDVVNPTELASKVSLETFSIQIGIGDKIPQFLFAFSAVVAGFIVGFCRGWELTLVLCGTIPFYAVAGGLYAWVVANIKKKTDEAYVYASGLVEQSFYLIKTVKALGGENFELKNLAVELKKADKIILKFGFFIGLSIGSVYFVMYCSYGLGNWFGSIAIKEKWYNSVVDQDYNVGNVTTVFISVVMGCFYLTNISPPIKAFIAARESSKKVFEIILRKPIIKLDDQSKQKIKGNEGDIVFHDVNFTYPSRKDVQILNKLNIHIQKNKKTAFVGESGSGKSTIVALVERFYDPNSGLITLDGVDLKEYNLNSLRKSIGYVGQEPVLFSGTIRENLLFGKEDATNEEIIQALKQANAYNFIQNLENNLDTFVGIGGSQLSGGQKQRLAIAKAILKNPLILILDEATSALDRTNEMEIQKTLDEISSSRTTIVIAHRLSTIKDADKIYVLDKGSVNDFGTHEELLMRQGKYEALVKIQMKEKKIEEYDENDSEFQHIVPEERPFLDNAKFPDSFPTYTPENEQMLTLEGNEANKHTSSKIFFKLEQENIKEPKKPDPKTQKKVVRRMLIYLRKNLGICSISLLGSIINGCIPPTVAIILGEILEKMALYWLPDYQEKVDFLALMFVVLAVAILIGNIFQFYAFSVLGERVSEALKLGCYEKLIKKEQKFFDMPENNPAVLSSKIFIETQQINSLISTFIGVMVQGISGFVAGLIIALFYSWQLTLIGLALSPMVVIGEYFEAKMMAGFQGSDEGYKNSASVIMESVLNIRTIASFCNEQKMLDKYKSEIDVPIAKARKKGIVTGFSFGFAYFLLFIYYALMFYIAAVFQDSEGLSLKDFYISLFAIMMAATSTGATSTFIPNIGECVEAGEKIFSILDSPDSGELSKNGIQNFEKIKGKIEFKNIYFKYPTRENYIFEDFSLTIEPGKKIGLVGPSGCGKSTLFQLLLRFYEFEKGEILIDEVNIKDLNVNFLRSLFGVVFQEPALFMGTIEYNIKYNNENATFEHIKNAAEQANALNFIINDDFDILKDNNEQGKGFQRKVGLKGGQISGGQKQRIAIARAILKEPNILLLDEATSALDSQNEKIVQDSLDKIMIGKTSIVIAHRISTIMDADEILVFGNGKIVERGNYPELIEKKGVFYKYSQGLNEVL